MSRYILRFEHLRSQGCIVGGEDVEIDENGLSTPVSEEARAVAEQVPYIYVHEAVDDEPEDTDEEEKVKPARKGRAAKG